MFLNKDSDFITRRLSAIEADTSATASDLAINALRDVADFAKNSYSETSEELQKNLDDFMSKIIAIRPSVGVLRLALSMLKDRVAKLGSLSLLAMRETYGLQAEDVEKIFIEKRKQTAENANKLIKSNMTLMTHGYSKSILQTLELAVANKKRLRCIISEARPTLQGKKMAKEIANLGISTLFVAEAEWGNVIMQADRVLLSAEAILLDGSFVGKIGSKVLSLAAQDAGVPVFLVADTFKHTNTNPAQIQLEKLKESPLEIPRLVKNIEFYNYLYDITPQRLIKTWIDERWSKDKFISSLKK